MSEESATGIDVPTKGRFLLEIEVEGPAMSVSEFGLTLSKQWIDYAGPLRLVACHGARAAGAAEPDANAALAMSQELVNWLSPVGLNWNEQSFGSATTATVTTGTTAQ